MAKRKIIIDCDPGQDDAVALFLAMASPDEFDILGITAVAGNVPLDLTQRNARQMCDIAGRTDVAVHAGCDRPMVRELLTAEKVHGNTGIDGVDIIDPETPLREQHAVDFIVDTLRAADDASVTLVPTGPLTNIGTVLDRAPDVLPKIQQLVIMGGAMREGGNYSPSAEFNILVDPHAADIVFNCGRPIVSMGLDVTHQVLSTRARVARIGELGNPVADATAGPELFDGKECNLSVETKSELTMGHTAIDFWHVTDRPHNVTWVYSVDADGFYGLLTERLARFGRQND
jgi:purine nucleosidase